MKKVFRLIKNGVKYAFRNDVYNCMTPTGMVPHRYL